MEDFSTDFLDQSKVIINDLKSLNGDTQKIAGIIAYLEATNVFLFKYGRIIQSLVNTQEQILISLTANTGSIKNLHDTSLSGQEQIETLGKIVEVHSEHLDTHSTIMDLNGTTLDLLSQRIDMLEN